MAPTPLVEELNALSVADYEIPFEETCIMCPRRGTKVCLTCKDARYCSDDCKILDENNHKILCKSFNDPKPCSKKANEIHHRGLFFPGGNQLPKFVWVKIHRQYHADDGLIFEIPDYDTCFPDGVDRDTADYNIVQARSMVATDEEKLFFHCGSMCVLSAPNLAIKNFTRGNACGAAFRGPWLIMSQHAGKPELSSSDGQAIPQTKKVKRSKQAVKYTYEEAWRDITMRDVRSAADYFTFAQRDGDDTVVLGAIMLSPGHKEQLQSKSQLIEKAFKVSNSYIFRDEGSGIANLLGLPIITRTMIWKREEGQDYSNPDVASLMADVLSTTTRQHEGFEDRQIGKNGFGSAHDSWDCNTVGSIRIVRADGFPMFDTHLEALVNYIHEKVEPRFRKAREGLLPASVVTEREAVLNSITRADFFDFWDKYQADKALTGDKRWQNMATPYHTGTEAHRRDVMADLAPWTNAMYVQQERAARK